MLPNHFASVIDPKEPALGRLLPAIHDPLEVKLVEINGHAGSTAERRDLFAEDCHTVVGRFARELQPPFPCHGGSVYSKRFMARFCRCRNSLAPAFIRLRMVPRSEC